MTESTNATNAINVKVELFGTPRVKSGHREVSLSLPGAARRPDLIQALALFCPALVGPVLRPDLSDLADGYVFNHNGLAFLGDGDFTISDGDCLLLISSQAGG